MIEAFRVLEDLPGLDARAVAALGDEQFRRLDQVLLARPGHFGDRVAEGRGIRPVDEVGERLGNAAGGDELGAHRRQVGGVAFAAPLDQFGDELVELGGAQDADGHGPVEVGLLLDDLGGVVAGVEVVGADDRDDEDAC